MVSRELEVLLVEGEVAGELSGLKSNRTSVVNPPEQVRQVAGFDLDTNVD